MCESRLSLGTCLAQNVLSHKPELETNSVDPLFSPVALSLFFPSGGKFAMLVMKDVTHMDNGQGSCGGSFD